MNPMIDAKRWLLAAALMSFSAAPANCDEGMWLYNRVPEEWLVERHGFKPTRGWLEHVQKSSVRLGGASAEFVSSEGLLLSNHHVGAGAIQRLSTRKCDYIKDGFLARDRSKELRCPGLEARVLLRIEDVTEAVNKAVAAGMSDQDAFEARRAAIARIEKSVAGDGIVGSVVTLFQGAEYHLYVYKQYTDLRLVFAPEDQIASFGGDADNFEYPRYCLDICFFRAYENGKAAKTPDFLQWSSTGVGENDLIFVSGNPGRTDRLRTISELRYLRDTEMPRSLERLKRIEVLLDAFSRRSAENERRAASDLGSAENGRKARDGMLAGLLDPQLMARKESAEKALRARAATIPELENTSGAFDRIAAAQATIARKSLEYDLLESATGFNSALFAHARRLVRAAEERSKPDEARLEEYRSSNLSSMELGLLAEAPIYADLETTKLADSLSHLAVSLGPESEFVTKVLADKSPRVRAAELVRGTSLGSAQERNRLYRAGSQAIMESKDPMIELARLVDPDARRARRTVETSREAIHQAQALIGKARYVIEGTNNYPDATGTLRLSFGTVKGYQEDGNNVPAWTTFSGLFERAAEHGRQPPFDLPPKWAARGKKLNRMTPFNFVCTADIIGGNSGSPVVNRKGELAGVIFDSNLQGLVADVEYSEEQARAVAVDARGIIEALRKIYDAQSLVDELLNTKGR